MKERRANSEDTAIEPGLKVNFVSVERQKDLSLKDRSFVFIMITSM